MRPADGDYTLTYQPFCKNCGGSYFQHKNWEGDQYVDFPCKCDGCPEDESQKCTNFEGGKPIDCY